MVFVHNLLGTPREVEFHVGLPAEEAGLLVNLLSEEHSRSRDSRHHMLLEGFGYRWFRAGGLDYLLKRSEIDAKLQASQPIRRRQVGRRRRKS